MVRFLLNLNVFLPAWALACASGGALLSMPLFFVSVVVSRFSHGLGQVLMATSGPASMGLVALGLAVVWRRCGLMPQHISAFRRRRFVLGHALLALATLTVGVAAAVPLVMVALKHDSRYGMLLWGLLPALLVAGVLSMAGLAMVWTAGESAAERDSPDRRWLARMRR